MSTSQPIRDKNELELLKNFYSEEEENPRNRALIHLGINSALRISDLLHLKWNDVYDFKRDRFRCHIIITEQKTKKETRIALNKNALTALEQYKECLGEIGADTCLFPGRYSDTVPLSRSQAFRIIRHAAEALNLEKGISCHSMRKTFGYHAWKSGVSPAVLMEIYNHSSYNITKRYLGIEQEDKDDAFINVNL